MRTIRKIIIHCSDSEFGDVVTIRKWHTLPPRNWKDIGYHYVILNGLRQHGGEYNPDEDGLLEVGREVARVGAHAEGDNHDSIGICLIGKTEFTEKQWGTAVKEVVSLRKIYGMPEILGHCETKSGLKQKKTCPNLSINTFRAKVAEWEGVVV